MVFLSIANFVRSRGPDEFWRKRKIFKLSAHFHGRRRNCYSLAIRGVHRSLAFATKGREQKKKDAKELWDQRITAACDEHGFQYPFLLECLTRMRIFLNRRTLADLAIWEPRTFKSLVSLAWNQASQDGLPGIDKLGPPPQGIITRGMLK